jgi:hypothetical protein
VGVWDVATGKLLTKFAAKPATQLELSDNGQRLLGFSPLEPKVFLWEMPK